MSFCRLDPGNNGFFILTMSSADGHQYLTEEAITDLVNNLKEVHENKAVRGLVTTCQTGSFCDGVDYDNQPEKQAAARLAEGVATVVRLLLELRVPTVAAVCGNATSLGLALALAHDHCVVWDHAVLRLPEAELGRPLPGYVAALLRNKLSYARLRKLVMLMSQPCTGKELARPWFSVQGTSDDRQVVMNKAIDLLYEIEVGEGTDYAKARQTMCPETCAAVGIIPQQRPRPSPDQLAASDRAEEESGPSDGDKSHQPLHEGLPISRRRRIPHKIA